MSVIEMDFKITPPKVKPRRGQSLIFLILRPLVCVSGLLIVPLIVYMSEGCTNLFWWMLGFGSLISLTLLSFDVGKGKLLKLPSRYKNFSPPKLSSEAKTTDGPLSCKILDGFEEQQPTTTPAVIEISMDDPYSSSSSGDLDGVFQQSSIFTPTKRRMVSSACVSLSPLKNEMQAPTETSPFSKNRLGFPGRVSPHHLGLRDTTYLSTILESPCASCNVDDLEPRRPSCFSS